MMKTGIIGASQLPPDTQAVVLSTVAVFEQELARVMGTVISHNDIPVVDTQVVYNSLKVIITSPKMLKARECLRTYASGKYIEALYMMPQDMKTSAARFAGELHRQQQGAAAAAAAAPDEIKELEPDRGNGETRSTGTGTELSAPHTIACSCETCVSYINHRDLPIEVIKSLVQGDRVLEGVFATLYKENQG